MLNIDALKSIVNSTAPGKRKEKSSKTLEPGAVKDEGSNEHEAYLKDKGVGKNLSTSA
ncbi:hypothetical protein KJ693_08620 [bacterium]|nr:hypothetical protein [bacterium]MBU1615362.1 hypothetical protein [bacterium]